MLSFAELLEQMNSAHKSPLMDSGEETKATELIRAGEQLRKEDQPSFWDDFLSLLSNSEGFAELFKIGSDKILSSPERIKEARSKLEKSDGGKSSPDEETEVMPTGDNGAITASNQDPLR